MSQTDLPRIATRRSITLSSARRTLGSCKGHSSTRRQSSRTIDALPARRSSRSSRESAQPHTSVAKRSSVVSKFTFIDEGERVKL